MKGKSIYKSLVGLMFFGALQAFTSCSDEPDAENYYTFTGEMVSDYLDNRPEQFSDFTKVLQRSGLYGMMATYGTYTCLAPTNEAMAQYLKERGFSSVEELTKEECDTLSWLLLVRLISIVQDYQSSLVPILHAVYILYSTVLPAY